MVFELQNGATLNYAWRGKGETLVFLPGILGSTQTFDGVLPFLEARFRCLTIEYCGQATTKIGSRCEQAEFSVERHADDIECLLNHLGIKSCHLIGLSYGSIIGQEIARRKGADILSLVLLASLLCNQVIHYRNWGHLWSQCSHHLDQFTHIGLGLLFSENYLRTLTDPFRTFRSVYEKLTPDNLAVFRHNIESAMSYPISSTFKTLNQPLRIVHGEADVIHPLSNLSAILAQLGKLETLRVIPTIGHGLHVEAPESVAKELLTFYSELGV